MARRGNNSGRIVKRNIRENGAGIGVSKFYFKYTRAVFLLRVVLRYTRVYFAYTWISPWLR